MDDFSTVGEYLSAMRRLKGISLEDIKNKTMISISNLESIEKNDFSRFPRRLYIIAFLKAYAKCIDIDPEKIAETYDRYKQKIPRN